MPSSTHVLVLAKAPVPGRVKTRLQPDYPVEHAARIAEAAIEDTLDAVRACAGRRTLVLDGPPGPWVGTGIEVAPQGRGSLDQRLAAAWTTVRGPALQIGMDTPQITPELLDAAFGRLLAPGTDAVLGLAADGGWWAIGLRAPVPGVFEGIPTSRSNTGARQLQRLLALGLRTALLPQLRDVDRPDDVRYLVAAFPHLRTARVAS